MHAVLLDADGRFRAAEIPAPKPLSGEILVRVTAAGVCASDLHLAAIKRPDELPYPILAGHELAGEVVEIGTPWRGDGGPSSAVGDAVAVNPNLPCGHCQACRRGRPNLCTEGSVIGLTRPGGFAELVAVPAHVVHAADGISSRNAALAEPLACALHGLDRVAVEPGRRALVYGAGAIGLLAMQVLMGREVESVTVVDPSPTRRATGFELGAEHALPVEDGLDDRLADLDPQGWDVVVDASGVPSAVGSATEHVADGGTLVLLGSSPSEARISIRPRRLQRADATVVTSFGSTVEFERALALLRSGGVRAEPLLGPPFPLHLATDAIEATRNGGQAVKVQFDPRLEA